jgi:hypothetical protein
MAIQTFDGLTFEGTLDTTLSPCDDAEFSARGTPPEGSLYIFGILRIAPARLYVGAPRLTFNGKVVVRGVTNRHDGEIGILQSILTRPGPGTTRTRPQPPIA